MTGIAWQFINIFRHSACGRFFRLFICIPRGYKNLCGQFKMQEGLLPFIQLWKDVKGEVNECHSLLL